MFLGSQRTIFKYRAAQGFILNTKNSKQTNTFYIKELH